jgi:hypothetical protein
MEKLSLILSKSGIHIKFPSGIRKKSSEFLIITGYINVKPFL